MTLAEKCKYIRNKMHINQRTLAGMIGTNQTEVSFMERGFIPEDPQKIYEVENLWQQMTM